MKKDIKRQLLLNTAKAIIHSEGHGAVTVRRVATETGYTYPILYHYFKDLGGFLWALRFDMIEDMIETLSPQPTFGDPVESVRIAFRAYADYFFDHPNVFRFFYFYPFIKPEADDQTYDSFEQRFGQMWQTTFGDLVQTGLLLPEDVELVAKTIIYALQGMILLSLSANGSMTRELVTAELDRLIDHLLKKRQCMLD